MPRKNKKDSEIVITSLINQSWFKKDKWKIALIHKCNHEKVAKLLQKSTIFLSFGHPEGFGLPLAEAAACGCYLIGYSGLGGREIFSLASKNNSGQEIAFGDYPNFLEECKIVNQRLNINQQEFIQDILKTSKTIRIQYSMQEMESSIINSIKNWEAQF